MDPIFPYRTLYSTITITMSSSAHSNAEFALVTDKVCRLMTRSNKLKVGDPAAKTLAHEIAMALVSDFFSNLVVILNRIRMFYRRPHLPNMAMPPRHSRPCSCPARPSSETRWGPTADLRPCPTGTQSRIVIHGSRATPCSRKQWGMHSRIRQCHLPRFLDQ